MATTFYLITEASFHASYLVTRWLEHFAGAAGLRGIALRSSEPQASLRSARERFHVRWRGKHELADTDRDELRRTYPDLSQSDEAMIDLFGLAPQSMAYDPRTIFLGSDLNSQLAHEWLMGCLVGERPFFFIFLDQLLDDVWIQSPHSGIINSHSAVLPYARGMFAIENMASVGSIDGFARAAGASVHYVDSGIDTGPIIKSMRINDPFAFDSIWHLKAALFGLAFDLLIEVARDVIEHRNCTPVGVRVHPSLRGPNFNRRDFTPEKRRRAEENYSLMKALGRPSL